MFPHLLPRTRSSAQQPFGCHSFGSRMFGQGGMAGLEYNHIRQGYQLPHKVSASSQMLPATMTLAEILPTLQALPRAEKLEAIRLLAEELAEEEKILSLIQPGGSYPIFSPYDATEAAAKMQEVLEQERDRS